MSSARGAAVVLAAGTARRYGSDKRLADVDGRPMLLRTLQPYIERLEHVVVVVRPDDPVRSLLPQSVRTVIAEDAKLGMGHSLAAAVRNVTEYAWLLVGLGDMPWITTNTITAIANCIDELSYAIVRPTYQGTPGHPVAFTNDFYRELSLLQGDEGARKLLRRESERLVELGVSDAGVLRDIDRPAQLNR